MSISLPVFTEDTPHNVWLKSSEDKYRSLLEDVLVSAAAGILILDVDFKVIWVSQALERYFGLRREELLDQDYRQLIHHRLKYIFEDPDGFAKEILATYIDNTAPARFECHVLPGEGRQERWLEHRSQPIHTGRYAGGRIEHYYGITNRKQAEQTLAAHARQQAALFHLSTDLVAPLDQIDICHKAVNGLRRTLGYHHVAIFLLDETTGERVQCASNPVLAEESLHLRLRPGEGLSELPLLDGRAHYTPDVTQTPRYVSGLYGKSEVDVPLQADGKILGVLVVENEHVNGFNEDDFAVLTAAANQTAVALARARLSEEHRRLSAAIEQTAESVIITDTAGLIVYVNPAFEQISGYNRVEVVGQNISMVSSDQHPPAFHQEVWATIRAGQVWHGQIINRKKNGTFYTEDVIITPVRNAQGEIINFVSVQRDITHELELEEQLRRSQRLEAVGQLTAGIAHDFNNSLTAINGFAELIQYQLPPDSSIYDMAGKILHSGQHAADLVTQLLAFSRKQMIRPKVLDLNRVVIDIEKMLQRVIGEQIELDIIQTTGLWPVEVDPTQLEQVIINLAVNARDAMPDGGKLTIETANVVLGEAYIAAHLETQPGDHVLLTVSDTGCGMSKAVQARIFEPFFTTKEVNEGTGLGLSTVFGIVKQSRGNIWVYSEEGVGTTFKIYLPRAAASIFSMPLTPVGILPRGVETILLVEDEALVRDLTSQVLREQGYTVLVARNGWEALRLAHEHIDVIHLLLTDVVMPGLGGKALADQLMAVSPSLKVLFTSGYTNNSVVTQGILLPGIKFLEKPFSSVSLTHKVREVLDGRTP